MERTYIQDKLKGAYGQVVTFNNEGNTILSYLDTTSYSAIVNVHAPLGCSVKFTKYSQGGQLMPDTTITVTLDNSELYKPSDKDAFITTNTDTLYVQTQTIYTAYLNSFGYWDILLNDGNKDYTETRQRIYINGPGNYDVYIGFFQAFINVDYLPGTVCTCSNGDITIVAPIDTTQYTFIVPYPGLWTISKLTEDTFGTLSTVMVKEANHEYNDFNISISSILEENSWSVIKYVATQSLGSSWWSVGDTKAISLDGTVYRGLHSTGISITFSDIVYAFIIGFDHNEAVEGIGIHFQIGKKSQLSSEIGVLIDNQGVYEGVFIFDHYLANWGESDLRHTLGNNVNSIIYDVADTFLGCLSIDLRSSIRRCNKYSYIYVDDEDEIGRIDNTSDYIFIPSSYELNYTSSADHDQYQDVYSYYANIYDIESLKQLRKATDLLSDTPCDYFTRTGSSWGHVIGIDVDGDGRQESVWGDHGCAPCFVIG